MKKKKFWKKQTNRILELEKLMSLAMQKMIKTK